AAGLRRICEQEFSEIASNLRAQLIYKTSQTWMLSDYRPAAYSSFGTLLRKARKAAESWDSSENVARIDTILLGLQSAEENARINWQTNKAIHFTNWGNFTKGEIAETVDSMHALVNAYRCSE